MTLTNSSHLACDVPAPTIQFHNFGRGVSSSKSPRIHNTGFRHHNLPCNYGTTEVKSNPECSIYIDRPNFGGARVAKPYQLEMSKYCNVVTKEAQLLEAVDTLCVRSDADGHRIIKGDNTDWAGILNCILAKYPIRTKGPPRVGWVIGAGRAARAAVYALHVAGTEKIFISDCSRSKAEAIARHFNNQSIDVEIVDDWQEMNAHPADIVIGTSPAHTFCDSDFSVVKWNPAGGLCMDVSYKPRVTPLLWVVAEIPKWKIVNGLEVLLEQEYVQYERWTGLEPPVQLMREAIGYDLS